MVEGMHLLQKVFDLDIEDVKATQYVPHGRSLLNVTCMRPRGGEWLDAAETRHYVINDELLAMDLEPGRLCENGACCDACSRVVLPSMATGAECNEIMSRTNDLLPPIQASNEPREQGYAWWKQHNLEILCTAAAGDFNLHLLYIRLLERMRRTVAHEYGIPLAKLSLQQSFIKRLTPEEYSKPGPVHVDECGTASHSFAFLHPPCPHADATKCVARNTQATVCVCVCVFVCACVCVCLCVFGCVSVRGYVSV